ncbi:hypothetical protein E2C01_070147 [Portunus trituberculatus]|uniref:Uncharacterized protein n=1 Tax=Portunus trituberculatus TaxID=210409 RepID=A0A5B7I0J3_PORTR|nr:hypothetical protein [Portunus trituberculatus]
MLAPTPSQSCAAPAASCDGRARCKKCSGYHDTDGCVREDYCLFCGSGHRPTSKQCLTCLQAAQLQELQHDGAHSLLDVKQKMRGILPGTFCLPNPSPKPHSPSKPGHPQPPPLCLTHPHTPKTPTSAPTLAPHPTPIQASFPAPAPDPTPSPIKPLNPIINVVLLTAQPPSPKAQWNRHHHKPHHKVTPPYPPSSSRAPTELTCQMLGNLYPQPLYTNATHQRFPSQKPYNQQPRSPCPHLVVQALYHPLPRFRPSMLRILYGLLLLRD